MIERKIIIGLITSTEYCQKVKDIWNPQLIESITAKRIAGWCWEYFTKYNKAPGREIETIYFTKLKQDQIPKDIALEFEEEILPGLSKEYEREEFNAQYLFEETEKQFNERHLTLFTDNIQALLAAGKRGEAEALAVGFKPLGIASKKIDPFILAIHQIRKKGRTPPIVYFKPWLKGGQTTIIYGNYGSGKSLLSISIAYLIGLKEYDTEDAEIGKWQVKNPTGCLYIDGELGELEMEERVAQFEWLGLQSPRHRIQILSVPEYQLETEDVFNLSIRENQQKIKNWLKTHLDYKLVVLDSASTLFGLVDENSNSEWNTKINPFLRDLRALDVACLLLHHAGKDNKRGLRGASSMGAMTHNIFRLTNHESKDIDEGEAWFTLSKDKQRASGFSFKTFSLHYTQTEDKKETHWELTDNF